MCSKHSYKDEISAKIALAKVRYQDKPHRMKLECRAYKCDKCNKYHLTSMKEYGHA